MGRKRLEFTLGITTVLDVLCQTVEAQYVHETWDNLQSVDRPTLLRALGMAPVGHRFEPKIAGMCDCPPRTSWDPHYTCALCGSYDSHAIHGALLHHWEEPRIAVGQEQVTGEADD